MELKKIMALAMMALMVIPSMTMTVGAQEEDMASAIARAQTYLDKVRAAAIATAEPYPPDSDMKGYLNELLDLLGEDWEDGPDFLLQSESGIAVISDANQHSGTYSVHLKTTGDKGNEARIVIPMPAGFTLGDLKTISWSVKMLEGYPLHVDIILDDDIDGLSNIDSLTAEIGENDNPENKEWVELQQDYEYNVWHKTFEYADEVGDSVVDKDTVLWVTRLGAGCDDAPYGTLAELKAGTVHPDPEGIDPIITIDKDVVVLRLELEVDYWPMRDGEGVDSEAYVDDIKINNDFYDFEEEEQEGLGAEGFLDQASASLGEGDIRSAARSLASARNIIGRINGLLKSMAKAHKVTRTERFNQKFQRRIEGIEDKIERPKGPKKK